jgi:hypothetical protein
VHERRISRALIFVWALSLPAAAPAFVDLSVIDLIMIGLMFIWPWLMPVLVVVLVSLWRRRSRRASIFRWTLSTALVAGTAGWLAVMLPLWQKAHHQRAMASAWDAIDVAVDARRYEHALDLLERHPEGDAWAYLRRQTDQYPLAPARLEFAAAKLFEPCTSSLLDQQHVSMLLDAFVERGHHELIAAWLAAPECRQFDGAEGREAAIRGRLHILVPYRPRADLDKNGLSRQQALALRALVQRYPALLEPITPGDCETRWKHDEPCTLMRLVFDKGHRPAVNAILPLDTRLVEHLPPVVAHILRDDVERARGAAKDDPEMLHALLAPLFATAPIDALAAALQAAPLDEETYLKSDKHSTQYQRLSPIVEAAESSDLGRPDWRYLELLLDQFPYRLAELDVDLIEYYGDKGIAWQQPQGGRIMQRLRAAGMSCERLHKMVSWGAATREDGQRAMALVKCPPPTGWVPYVQPSR